MNDKITELNSGFMTAFIDSTNTSSIAYRPQFVSNDYRSGRKVIAAIESELLSCEKFQISVAFINKGGITPLLPVFKELEKRGVPGEILTTNYLNFSEPQAIEKLNSFSNITVKMFDVARAGGEGFHTKGYIFRKDEIFRIIIGSSNLTSAALTRNREWNTKIISSAGGEMAQDIVNEFNKLWNSEYALSYDLFFEEYKNQYRIISYNRRSSNDDKPSYSENTKLQPNKMQRDFIRNLRKITDSGEERALLISSTGTGKTFASAFAVRDLGFKRILFLVHRGQLARQTLKAYRRVFGEKVKMGLVGAGKTDFDADFIFATVQTLNKDEHLNKYAKDHFDCIILDEAHHVSANIYQRVMRYFTPSLWLGMTATPDKRDDAECGNIYEIFNYQIAYEIRLQQAMEEDFLCPFHYFGITDLSMIDDSRQKTRKIDEEYFNRLTGDERVRHIIEQAKFYGYSGDRVKGLIFCSRIEESVELSNKFNQAGYRTIALNGDASSEKRAEAFERLAMNENDANENMKPLDYIFSVDILNEGVDIVEVNQVIMLRPTQSPIVFIQQLGRGLRKAEGKEYVVIIDFIGNYTNNFMIPIALSGDCSYNPDNIRKYVISGNSVIPGASTVHFDEVAKERIFRSIDSIKGLKAIIRERYSALKNRIGRMPYLYDFYQNNEIDPLVIIREFKTYHSFLESTEHELYNGKLSEQERLTLEYLSKTILSGTRPYELEILKRFTDTGVIDPVQFCVDFKEKYSYDPDKTSLKNAIMVLKGHFVSKDEEYEKFKVIDIIDESDSNMLRRTDSFASRLKNEEFCRQINDIISVGLNRYRDKYYNGKAADSKFVLYEKYSRRDVSLLMNCGKDMSSTMYGMKRIDDDVFIFVTYHKEESSDETKSYVDGKPDYADVFDDNTSFRWDSQIGRGIDSSYVADVTDAANKHLLVKKSDSETGFYYMGQFDIIEKTPGRKNDNSGRERDITKFRMRMKHAVRDDLLQYLQSNITEKDELIG